MDAKATEGEQHEVLTVAEAAELLQVAQQTVRSELTAGRLPGRKVGKAWRLSRAAVAAYIGSNSLPRAERSGGPPS